MPTTRTDRLEIRSSDDVVRVRQQARTMAVAAGLSLVDQTKIITAASELARNTLDYGGGGEVRMEVVEETGAAECASCSKIAARASLMSNRRCATVSRQVGSRPRVGRRKAAVERIQDRDRSWFGHQNHYRALENMTISIAIKEEQDRRSAA